MKIFPVLFWLKFFSNPRRKELNSVPIFYSLMFYFYFYSTVSFLLCFYSSLVFSQGFFCQQPLRPPASKEKMKENAKAAKTIDH